MYAIRALKFKYPGRAIPALDGIDLDFRDGEFIVLCGPNGGGKSTFLKTLMGVEPQYSGGVLNGEILFRGKPVKNTGTVELAGSVGILLQDPDSQITNLTCFEEAVFGPENLKLSPDEIRLRATQSLTRCGLGGLEDRGTHQLSGGQKQRLSLAALLAMKPGVLLMDEPLANLDPLGVSMVIGTLRLLKSHHLCIVSTHIVEPFKNLATRYVAMDRGCVVLDFPAALLESQRTRLEKLSVYLGDPHHEAQMITGSGPVLISADEISFRYGSGPDILQGISLDIHAGERLILTGNNGSGKSTLAKVLAGLRRPTGGMLKNFSRRSWYSHQDPTVGFLMPTVLDDLRYGTSLTRKQAVDVLESFGLGSEKDNSPYILSGGQQRLLALATAVSSDAGFLSVDEPTASLDAGSVRMVLESLSRFSGTVLHITHDHRVVDASTIRHLRMENGRLTEVTHDRI